MMRSRELSSAVAEIVERYRAASAWLFAYLPHRQFTYHPDIVHAFETPLNCVVARKVQQKSRHIRCSGTQDHPWPANVHWEGKLVLYQKVVQEVRPIAICGFFASVKHASQSAVAVPIVFGPRMFPDRSNLVCVLVLEASEPFRIFNIF